MNVDDCLEEIAKFHPQVENLPGIELKMTALEALQVMIQLRVRSRDLETDNYPFENIEHLTCLIGQCLGDKIPELDEHLNQFFELTKPSKKICSTADGATFDDLSMGHKWVLIGQVMGLNAGIKALAKIAEMSKKPMAQAVMMLTMEDMSDMTDQDVSKMVADINKDLKREKTSVEGCLMVIPDPKDN